MWRLYKSLEDYYLIIWFYQQKEIFLNCKLTKCFIRKKITKLGANFKLKIPFLKRMIGKYGNSFLTGLYSLKANFYLLWFILGLMASWFCDF